MRKTRILWTDDEVEGLRPHIIFLDENMPGLSGIETLRLIREVRTDIPVVMITKSEEEDLMETAIGSEIADYLIKPVKPKQILLAIKKIIDQRRLVTEKTTTDYRQEFSRIADMISIASSCREWSEIYKKIIFWESELEKSADSGMKEVLRMQENE